MSFIRNLSFDNIYLVLFCNICYQKIYFSLHKKMSDIDFQNFFLSNTFISNTYIYNNIYTIIFNA